MIAPRRLALACLALLLGSAARADHVWIEAESLARPPAGFKVGGWGNKHYLSGDAWLFAAIDGKDAENLPADGLTLTFPFAARADGKHEVWARVGYEFVRSPFRWRLDDGAWGQNGPQDLTTDLMEVAEWAEVAWVKLGTAQLAAGQHTLSVQFERRVPKGKTQPDRVLAGLDCFCLSTEPFRPNGRHRPDEDWQTPDDKKAAAHTFAAKADGPRTEVPLKGTWQIARYDEQEIVDRDEPVKELPALHQLFWKAVQVPGSRDTARPDMLYCHRFLYRTRVAVPAEAGRAYVLRFPSTALIASVFVNGKYCGGSTAPCAAWEADVTAAVKPGRTNEVVVAIKDCYYALEKTGDGKSPRLMFNYPVSRFYNDGGLGATRFADFPVLFQVRGAGLLETPTLTVTGPVHVSDVFALPSARRKELGLEITVRNSSAEPTAVAVDNAIVPAGGGKVALTFAAKKVTVEAGGEQTVRLAEPWADPKLWWPDDPQLYDVVTRVSLGGRVLDERRTRFGFREWGWKGMTFTLNGIPWRFRADLLHNGKLADPEKAAADWRKAGINTVRYWGMTPWVGDGQASTLDFYDRVGMPVRRSGIFDGQVASYQLVEQKDGKTVPRKRVFDNWIHQMKAWVKAERNHPSIFVWSVENEVTYINVKNFGWLDACEPEIKRAVAAVMEIDPTRPAMTDGGDALRDQSLPIYGNHYNEGPFRLYPVEAYTMAWAYTRHKTDPRAYPWPLGEDRPLFLGETFFAAGFPPAAFAAVQGEPAFLGRSAAEAGVRKFARMLAEGYRWHGLAGFHFWMAGDGPDNDHYQAFQPVAAFTREWNRTFGSGQTITRTVKVFNDTRSADPILLIYNFETSVGDGAYGTKGQKFLEIPPGMSQEVTLELSTPKVTKRSPATLTLECWRREGDKPVFHDVKSYFVLAPAPALVQEDAAILFTVFDPSGVVQKRLRARKIGFDEVKTFDDVAGSTGALIVGPDALTPRQATDPRWVAWAAAGRRILVLDQKHPLRYQALPADLEPTPHAGRVAFPENLDHPAFAGLGAEDFFTWAGDHVVYRNAYKKATRGARSLLQCDEELAYTALAECPVGRGLLVLSQANVGARLADDPVAQRLFDNLVAHVARYEPAAKVTASVLPAGDERAKLLDAIGLKHRPTADVMEALKDAEIVVADASPPNLAQLAASPDAVKAFAARGGTLMLWGLTPAGLNDFNRVVGVDHLIRPFGLERVTLPAVRDPLLSGLTTRDVVLESTERIYPWAGDRYPAKDTFTHVVDLADAAPFMRSKDYAHGWSQMTNGLTSADSWKFIFYHDLSKADPKPRWSAELPRPAEVDGFSVILNTHYHLITKLRLVFDGDEKAAVTLDLKPGAERKQDFALEPRPFRRLTLEPVAWDAVGKQPVIGVDNLWVRVRKGEEYTKRVVPLVNVGGLVKYRAGKGAVLLNQLHVPAAEANPVNPDKKRAVVATLLRNLGATFAAERRVVAGADLAYTPLPLEEKATGYLTAEKGWVGGTLDLGHLPVGEQKLAGVPYVIRDFRTSPLPAAVVLAGPGTKGPLPAAVEGLPVGRKADLLSFLHTFHRTKAWARPADPKADATPPAVFQYVIHYADGQTAVVPVRYERGVGHWVDAEPHGRPDAAVAWAAPFPRDPGRQAVVYQMTWPNPRPAVAIARLDVRYDPAVGSAYGVPVVLAVTAGAAR